MNRSLSILSILLVGGIVLFAAGAWGAEDVSFELSVNGLSYVSGPMFHYPMLDISVETDVTQPGPFGIARERAWFNLDALTGECSGGQLVFVTAGGDVLYARGLGGQVYPDPEAPNDPDRFQSVLYQEYVGGTGPFAGVRGMGTSTARHRHLSPVLVTVEDAVITGTLSLAGPPSEMVAMKTMEGELVGLPVLEPEAYPMFFQEITHTGNATHCGAYVNSKVSLLDFTEFPLVPLWGFFTKTAADGDVMEGYYEGHLAPLAKPQGAFEAAMELWIAGGTGRFENATGHETGGGLVWLDGREDIILEGTISSLGSSK